MLRPRSITPTAPAEGSVSVATPEPMGSRLDDLDAVVNSVASSRERGSVASSSGSESAVARTRSTATLTVTLRVADTQERLVDAFVALVVVDTPGQEREISRDRSDSSGQVRLWCECRDDLRMKVTPNDALAVTAMPVTVPVSMLDCRDREMDVLVPAFDAYEFHGRVLDAVSLRPIAGLAIAGPATTVMPISTVSDSSGRFALRIRHVSQDTSISVGAPTYGRVDVRLDRTHPNEASAAVIVLRPGATLRGIVLDANGGPVHRGWVAVDSALRPDPFDPSPRPTENVYVTNDDGRFVTGALVPGVPYDVAVSVGSEGVSRRLQGLVLAPGEVRDVELRMPATHVVRGRVLDEAGRSVANVPIELRDTFVRPWAVWYDDGEVLLRAESAVDGSFVLENVPSGRWWLEAAVRNDDALDEEPQGPAVRRELEVPELAGDVVTDLHLVASERIDGFLRDEEGAGIEDCSVFARFESGGGVQGAMTEADGRFVFSGLTKGVYVMYASCESGRDTNELRVASGTRGVVLTAPTGGTVVGKVVGSDGKPVASPNIHDAPFLRFRRSDGDSNHVVELDGAFVARHVPAGEWELRAEADGRASAWRTVHVVRNESLEVGEIVLERTGRIHFVWPASTSTNTSNVRVEVRRGKSCVGFLTLSVGRDAVLDVPAGDLSIAVGDSSRSGEPSALHLEPGTESVVTLTPP